jgi:hypothetical protein
MRIFLVRDQANRLKKTIIFCECGGYYGLYHNINNYHNKIRHEKTKIHNRYLDKLLS